MWILKNRCRCGSEWDSHLSAESLCGLCDVPAVEQTRVDGSDLDVRPGLSSNAPWVGIVQDAAGRFSTWDSFKGHPLCHGRDSNEWFDAIDDLKPEGWKIQAVFPDGSIKMVTILRGTGGVMHVEREAYGKTIRFHIHELRFPYDQIAWWARE